VALVTRIHPEERQHHEVPDRHISGIALALAGAVIVTHSTSNASANPLTTKPAPVTQTQSQQPVATFNVAAKPTLGLTGELSRNDQGALELKLTSPTGVERELRVLAAQARVSNRAGQLARIPLDDATVHLNGVMAPRATWSIDQDGQATPTIDATHIVVLTTAQTDQPDTQDTQTADDTQDTPDTQDSGN
jgi:hypothetical protein